MRLLVTRRRESFNLPSWCNHGLVRLVQVNEFSDELASQIKSAGFIQHEVPQKSIQVTKVLCGLCLMKKLQGEFVFNPEQPAKSLAVTGKLFSDQRIGKHLFKLPNVEIRSGKQLKFLQGERTLEDHVLLAHVGGRVRAP